MVTLTQDPNNPDKLILTQTVVLYLDKVLLTTLDAALASAIQEQAVKDLQHSTAVKKLIAKAATEKLLKMLGFIEEVPNGN